MTVVLESFFYFMFRIDEALNLKFRDDKYVFFDIPYAAVNVPWRNNTDSDSLESFKTTKILGMINDSEQK
jgi:hypothetical protein